MGLVHGLQGICYNRIYENGKRKEEEQSTYHYSLLIEQKAFHKPGVARKNAEEDARNIFGMHARHLKIRELSFMINNADSLTDDAKNTLDDIMRGACEWLDESIERKGDLLYIYSTEKVTSYQEPTANNGIEDYKRTASKLEMEKGLPSLERVKLADLGENAVKVLTGYPLAQLDKTLTEARIMLPPENSVWPLSLGIRFNSIELCCSRWNSTYRSRGCLEIAANI